MELKREIQDHKVHAGREQPPLQKGNIRFILMIGEPNQEHYAHRIQLHSPGRRLSCRMEGGTDPRSQVLALRTKD